MYISHFQFTTDEYLGSFQFFTIFCHAATNILVHVSLYTHTTVFVGNIFSSRIDGPSVCTISILLRFYQKIERDYIDLHSHQQKVIGPFPPHTGQYMISILSDI